MCQPNLGDHYPFIASVDSSGSQAKPGSLLSVPCTLPGLEKRPGWVGSAVGSPRLQAGDLIPNLSQFLAISSNSLVSGLSHLAKVEYREGLTKSYKGLGRGF